MKEKKLVQVDLGYQKCAVEHETGNLKNPPKPRSQCGRVCRNQPENIIFITWLIIVEQLEEIYFVIS